MKTIQVFLTLAIILRWTAESARNDFINVKHLKIIGNSMDIEANPCQNFYQYACGKWAEQHADDSNKYKSLYDMVDYQINSELVELMESMTLEDKPEFVRKAFDFYASCRNTHGEWNAMNYIHYLEEHENMTWALLENSQYENLDWIHVLAISRRYNLKGFLISEYMHMAADEPARLVIGSNYLVEGTSYIEIADMKAMLETLPGTEEFSESWWEDFENFRMQLHNLRITEYKDSSRKLMQVKDLPHWVLQFVTDFVGSESLDPDMQLFVEDLPYLEALGEFLQLYNPKLISIYLELGLLTHFRDQFDDNPSTGCMTMTRSLMPLAINWLYEQYHLGHKERTTEIKNIFENIVEHINHTLGHRNIEILKKLNDIQFKVGNLPRVDTIQALESFYASLDLQNDDDFLNNEMAAYQFVANASRYFNKNTLSSNVSQYFYAAEPNYFLSKWLPMANIVILPTMALRQPYDHWGYAKIYQYTTLGQDMADAILNEITHNALTDEELRLVNDVGKLHVTYEAYFSTDSSALDESKDINGIHMSMKKLFFLSAAQSTCGSYGDDNKIPTQLNAALSKLPEFAEAFDCKSHKYVHFFAN